MLTWSRSARAQGGLVCPRSTSAPCTQNNAPPGPRRSAPADEVLLADALPLDAARLGTIHELLQQIALVRRDRGGAAPRYAGGERRTQPARGTLGAAPPARADPIPEAAFVAVVVVRARMTLSAGSMASMQMGTEMRRGALSPCPRALRWSWWWGGYVLPWGRERRSRG